MRCTRFRYVVEAVDHTASLKLKLIRVTLDHGPRQVTSLVADRGGAWELATDFSSSQHVDQELLRGAVVGASGPGASPCPCVVSAHAHDGALRGALSW